MQFPFFPIFLLLLLFFFSFHLDARTFARPAPRCKHRPVAPRTSTKKVFVIGLPKSGTTSMGAFFYESCMKVRKHEADFARADGDFSNYTTLGRLDVLTNSAEWYYADIEEALPGKFIFVVVKRDVESWLHSARKHFCFDQWDFSDTNFQSFGIRTYNENHFRRVYEMFYREIDVYFADRWEKDAFLVNVDDLSRDQELEIATMKKLAKAAGSSVEAEGIGFRLPHQNERKGYCQFGPSRVSKINITYVDPKCVETCVKVETPRNITQHNITTPPQNYSWAARKP
eukprot:CAMPEP_0201532280 /NCGR_PEP_ID=MMETSP0161_2-20130828/49954_1 /ASSEMBLY_ACC=CAM_ASM_000251 /TAXON_ID=180227 /ORGANISM="Neoparamoeba aestuarina, Strain SoJaBio B1-5/56/2" /LENGTH=284 /DNA_ID=CAMNT_0047935605 /DNA_START=116 /DNA_END=970 /DNA_ORIENTATION=+